MSAFTLKANLNKDKDNSINMEYLIFTNKKDLSWLFHKTRIYQEHVNICFPKCIQLFCYAYLKKIPIWSKYSYGPPVNNHTSIYSYGPTIRVRSDHMSIRIMVMTIRVWSKYSYGPEHAYTFNNICFKLFATLYIFWRWQKIADKMSAFSESWWWNVGLKKKQGFKFKVVVKLPIPEVAWFRCGY